GLAVETVASRIDLEPTDGFPGYEPTYGDPRIVRGDARGVSAGGNLHAALQNFRNWRCGLCGTGAVALDEKFALIVHAMLDGDAAAQPGDAVDRALRDRLGVVEEPVDPVQRNVAIDLLKHIKRAPDRLVIGCVQAPGPAVLRENADHILELAFHVRW